MNKFKFKYSALVFILLILSLALCVAGIVWNIFNAIQFANVTTIKLISSLVIVVLTFVLLVFVLSVLFYSRYVIKDGYLYTYFGFVKNKTPVSEIVEVTKFKKSNKLVVYFSTEEYTVIVIAPEFYDEFVMAIRNANKSIVYDARIEGEDTPE